jgi:hypothetical protein
MSWRRHHHEALPLSGSNDFVQELVTDTFLSRLFG